MVFASIGLGWKTTVEPSSSGSHIVPVKPNEWNSGRTPMNTSLYRAGKACASESALANTLAWVSITPLGAPVLPLEKMIVARFGLASRRGPYRRFRIDIGVNRAEINARSLSLPVTSWRRSSRNAIPGISGRPAFSRNFRDVRMVLMPDCRIARSSVPARS